MRSAILAVVVLGSLTVSAQEPIYDLLLKGGHVIDPKNNIDKLMDVAVSNGKIASVAENISASKAKTVADVKGLYVTPGLIDMHVHVYNATPVTAAAARSNSVWPDAFSFRSGVTTMVDAGTSGSANFEDFKKYVIEQSKTRVLAFVNISRQGMTDFKNEDKVEDLDTDGVVALAKAYPSIIVGFKSAHYGGPGWASIDHAVEASRQTNRPVMVDFGIITPNRNLDGLLRDKLRKGDIYTHCFSGNRREVMENNQLNPAMEAGRRRGIYFDIGFGGGSFYWWVAVPAYQAKFYPDSISTDLHKASMNGGMKDMLQTMSKIMALGSSLPDVIRMSTINPAIEIKHPELGSLDLGSEADIAVLRLDHGRFGLTDSAGARKMGDKTSAGRGLAKSSLARWTTLAVLRIS